MDAEEIVKRVQMLNRAINDDERILYKYRDEMILNWMVLGNELDYVALEVGSTLITADDVKCRVVYVKEINLICDEHNALCQRIYGVSGVGLLRVFAERYSNSCSLFKHLKLEKV